jgi:hypothetical protein
MTRMKKITNYKLQITKPKWCNCLRITQFSNHCMENSNKAIRSSQIELEKNGKELNE